MTAPNAIPSTFFSRQIGDARRPLVVRESVADTDAETILDAVRAIRWNELWHAYGPADDVDEQLLAAALGDDDTRKAAWWELFGNIHHQGTIYEATLPAVPIIARLARWPDYPDRDHAFAFLTAVAQAEGVVVWRYDADGRFAVDDERSAALSRKLRPQIREISAALLCSWRDEPERVQPALLLLLAYMPELQEEHADFVAEVLPARFDDAWSAIQTGADSEEALDSIDAFERWAHGPSG